MSAGTKKVTFAGTNGGSKRKHSEDKGEAKDPPSFRPPPANNGDDHGRYELWTIRMPADVQIEDLDGQRLNLDSDNLSKHNFESNGNEYSFQWGHQAENESFRVLLPAAQMDDASGGNSSSSSDSDDDDNVISKKKYLYPSNTAFQRHLTITRAVQLPAETELAPRLDNAPTAVAAAVRRAYQPVPQKMGLKRRWVPIGAAASSVSAKVETDLPKRAVEARNELPKPSPEQKPSPAMNGGLDVERQRKERKESKKERKAAKKAAKKAKKEKKAHKKGKKENGSL